MAPEIPKAKILEQVFNISSQKDFRQAALSIFKLQFETNIVYREYCEAIRTTADAVHEIEQIPFLPIQFFKSKKIVAGSFEAQAVFKSSGTTAHNRSHHYIGALAVYEDSFFGCFQRFYGAAENFCILGLLPSYIENGDSSLVYMVDALIRRSGHKQSGFYLHDYSKLQQTLALLEQQGQKTILFGVSYALLDFADRYSMPLQHTTIVETGGMKGRKKEITKAELYARLQKAFSLHELHSEYGMTELLSQAYAVNGIYQAPPWMKILLREETDPFSFSQRSGIINVIDLANIHSCSFIATDDLGRLHGTGSFEVLGRVDNSDVRGCSQLVF